MSLPGDVKDRTYAAFRDAGQLAGVNQTKVAVSVDQDPGSPIPVFVTDTAGYVASYFVAEATGVPQGVETTILTKVVTEDELRLMQISCSGSNKARYTVTVDSNIIDRRYTYYTNLTSEIEFNRNVFVTGAVISVSVNHDSVGNGDFFVRITAEVT